MGRWTWLYLVTILILNSTLTSATPTLQNNLRELYRIQRQADESAEYEGSSPDYQVEEGSGIEEELSPEVTGLSSAEEDGSGDGTTAGIEQTVTVEDLLGLDVTAVLEPPPLEEGPTTPMPPCASSPYGCCSLNNSIPAHGSREEGCCLTSEHGCCPDLITHAVGAEEEGCFCSETDFGCCPDGLTAAQGPDNLGCGCVHSPFGCCPDQVTVSPGENQEGCPCHTTEFGCCGDGNGQAQGPNLEGCQDCTQSEHGCCPDNFTPATGPEGADCGCAGSEHGCCSDGESLASGPDFQGCSEVPGEYCNLPKASGDCRENFEVKWWFDMTYGGCSRFWYSDCGDQSVGNGNRFDDEQSCQAHCVKPSGSGRCYLPKVRGPCKAVLTQWYFDRQWNKCVNFTYGGCLGNANNFETMQECQDSCFRTPDHQPVCSQPYEPGPCR